MDVSALMCANVDCVSDLRAAGIQHPLRIEPDGNNLYFCCNDCAMEFQAKCLEIETFYGYSYAYEWFYHVVRVQRQQTVITVEDPFD